MTGRGTNNSPNTRNPERPASHPSRLDQFADDLAAETDKLEEKISVTSRKEKEKY